MEIIQWGLCRAPSHLLGKEVAATSSALRHACLLATTSLAAASVHGHVMLVATRMRVKQAAPEVGPGPRSRAAACPPGFAGTFICQPASARRPAAAAWRRTQSLGRAVLGPGPRLSPQAATSGPLRTLRRQEARAKAGPGQAPRATSAFGAVEANFRQVGPCAS